MRAAVLLLACALLLSACGGGKGHTKSTSTRTSATTNTQVRTPTTPKGPQYMPSAHHEHRPRGAVYNDEIGENIVTATRSRVLRLFGAPAARRGGCLSYRIVGQRGRWLFCFKGERMTSAKTLRG